MPTLAIQIGLLFGAITATGSIIAGHSLATSATQGAATGGLLFLTLLITDYALDRWLAREVTRTEVHEPVAATEFESHNEDDTQQDNALAA